MAKYYLVALIALDEPRFLLFFFPDAKQVVVVDLNSCWEESVVDLDRNVLDALSDFEVCGVDLNLSELDCFIGL